MLDLSRKLTDKLVIDDEEFPLNLSFDNVLRLFEMWRDEDVPEFVKPHFGIRILTGETLEDFTVEEMSEVFNEVFEEHISLSTVEDNHVEYDLAGNPMKTTASNGKQEQAPYDIRFDGDYIYASFLQAYGIDLFDVQGKLHWKKFNALLSGLPEGTKFMEVVKIRKWKPQKGDSAEYKDEMRRLQKDYALPYEIVEEEEYEEEF
ncbi:Gp15 family bacteriophage protein [Streptococcus salivarius]|uniref:Gp15 family bacteriophage protein n=1 Tax=Streptococcus salivarius TaxID=1304 RepID=A0AAW6D4T8_STRSL|nr:Gp15 family bacteriophage protein [Streptococcus salivarius]MDB8613069.1 Gp15 family bacteriophage protein [Streptococcus salivarius]